jgi:polyadenylate-binding protein
LFFFCFFFSLSRNNVGGRSIQPASLYVGDLASDITEGMLFELFNQVGPVASIRVCRDAVTRRSLGYSYVNFHSVADAERALDTINNTPIKGKLCRIMWSQRDPSARKSGSGNIFIKNLDKSIDHKTLFDTFSIFGNILSCKVVAEVSSGESKGYGFVHFDSDDAAKNAIAKVNGMMLAGKKVFVAPFLPKGQRSDDGSGPRFTNVYVKNLPDSVKSDADLKALFAEFGAITSVMLPAAAKAAADKEKADKADDASDTSSETSSMGAKGYGFVNFETPEAAAAAIKALNGKEVQDGRQLYVGRAQKKSEREAEMRQQAEQRKLERISKYQGINLYVKNLEDSITDDKLREEFAPYGTITSCRVMVDEKNASRGFGFVCFSTPEEATRAVTELNGKMLGSKPVYVAVAQRKDVRRAQLEMQHARRQAKPALPGAGVPGAVPGMYAPGAPVFYAAPPSAAGGPGGQPGFVYPQQMMPRGGPRQPWTGAPTGPYPMPGAPYVVGVPPGAAQVAAQAQQRRGPGGPQGQPQQGQRGGNLQQGGQQRAGQQQVQQAQAQQQQQRGPAPNVAATMQAIAAAPLDPKRIAELPAEQQKMVLGEKLYPLIAASQPELAGKITGMLLDSYFSEEIIHLIETPAALKSKIEEALTVLQQHAAAQAQA